MGGALLRLVLSFRCMGKREQHAIWSKCFCPLVWVSVPYRLLFVPRIQLFTSIHTGRSDASVAWYTNDVDRPIKRLKTQLLRSFPGWNISLPSDDNCFLTATQNIVGRYLNNVDLSHVCDQGATARGASGKFIHIEQAEVSVDPASYGSWAAALRETFATT